MPTHYSFDPTFTLYTKRFLILVMVGVMNGMLTFQQQQFAIIANIVKYFYDVGDQAVVWTVMIMFVSGACLLFVSAWFHQKCGLRVSFIVVTTLTCASMILKLFAIHENRFWMVLLAQAIAGVSGALNSPFPLTVSRVWFPNHQINRATVFVDMFGIGGVMLTSLITAFVPNSENKYEIKQALCHLFITQAIVAFLLFVCAIAFFDEKPKTPPSHSQSVVNNLRGDTSIFTYFGNLLTPNILCLLFVFGVNTSFRLSFNTLLNQTLMTKLDDTRLVGLTLLLTTSLKLFIEYSVSHILDRKHNFKLIICTTFTISSMLYLCDAFALRTSNVPVIIATSVFLGSTLGPNRPTLLNLGAELTYPTPESVINNAMVFCGQISVIVFTPINSAIITHFGATVMNIGQCCLMIAIMFLTFAVKSNLRRQQEEQERTSLLA